jgi:predicted nuclease of predicted toxin-antitoxin system
MNSQTDSCVKVRFLIDKSAGTELANGLKACGYDVKNIVDDQLEHKNADLFTAAWEDKRVIVTHNPEFLDDHRFSPKTNAGIIFLREYSEESDNERVVRCLGRALRLSREDASWFEGKKLDFASDRVLTIRSPGSCHRYIWNKC